MVRFLYWSMTEIDDLKHQIEVLELRLRIARLEKELSDLQSKPTPSPWYTSSGGTWTYQVPRTGLTQKAMKAVPDPQPTQDVESTYPHSDSSQNRSTGR